MAERRLLFIILFTIFHGIFFCEPFEDIVKIKDPILEKIIRTHLNKPYEPIFISDIENIKNLKADNSSINTLDGLENVKIINGNWSLTGNNLKNLNGFRNLKKINGDMWLGYNQLESIEGLGNLEEVKGMLILDKNRIKTLDGLSSLKSVSVLHLNNNIINDLNGILNRKESNKKSFYGLNLFLFENEIDDISPLREISFNNSRIYLMNNNLHINREKNQDVLDYLKKSNYTDTNGIDKCKFFQRLDDGIHFDSKLGVYNIADINTEYNEYNPIYVPRIKIDEIYLFTYSTDKVSKGKNFDIVEESLKINYYNYDFESNYDFEKMKIKSTEKNYSKYKFNTEFDEFGANYISDSTDKFFLFSSNKPFAGKDVNLNQNIYFIDDSNTNGINYFKGNSAFDDFYPTYHEDSKTFYFCSNRSKDKKFHIYKIKNNESNLGDFFKRDIKPEDVTLVEELSSNKNDKCPFIKDNIMLFVSDRSGGYGGMDIYFSIFKNGKWSVPKLLPIPYNSRQDEYRPSFVNINYNKDSTLLKSNNIFSDMFSIIFSSNRKESIGGYDLYFGILPVDIF